MMRAASALILLAWGSTAVAAETDWGIREVGKSVRGSDEPPPAGTWALEHVGGRAVDMGSVKQIGARWGQVTSTYRSPAT